MPDLKGKTAIVTGASRGIGKALASTAASLGINLAIAARTEGPLKETAEEIEKKYKVKVLPVTTDVTKLEDLENLVNKAKEKFGKIDILINNAGVSSQYPFQIINLPGDMRGIARGVKAGDSFDKGPAAFYIRPELPFADARRADHADSRNRNFFHYPPNLFKINEECTPEKPLLVFNIVLTFFSLATLGT